MEDLIHAAVMFSHHQVAASTTRPAVAGLAITLFSLSWPARVAILPDLSGTQDPGRFGAIPAGAIRPVDCVFLIQ